MSSTHCHYETLIAPFKVDIMPNQSKWSNSVAKLSYIHGTSEVMKHRSKYTDIYFALRQPGIFENHQ